MSTKRLDVSASLLLGIFSLGIILVLPLRVYQYLAIIEPGTGFYEKTDFSIPLMYALLAAFGGCMLLISAVKKHTIVFSTTLRKTPVLGLISFGTAVTLMMNAVIMSKNFSTLYYGISENIGPDGFVESATSGMMKSGALPMIFEAFFAVLAALFFVVLGAGYVTGKSNGSEYKLLAITPLAWAICRILHRFMRTISFMNVSDLFFELLMIVLLMVFFMAFAQTISRVNHKGSDWKLAGFGLPAALMGLLCFVPRVAMLVMGKGNLLAAQSPPEYVDFALAVFIVAFILSKVRFLRREEVN
jgi:hypothetical protein